MGKLYTTLSLLRRDHKALSRGGLVRVQTMAPADVYAFFRMAGSDKILTVLNFSAGPRTDTLTVPMEKVFPGEKKVVMKEVFSGRRLEITPDGQGKIALPLEPLGYMVFVLEKTYQ